MLPHPIQPMVDRNSLLPRSHYRLHKTNGLLALLVVMSLLLPLIAVPAVQADSDPNRAAVLMPTADASFFVTDWPLSSLFGFLALIGLLWLGNQESKRGRKNRNELMLEIRRKADGVKEWLSAFGPHPNCRHIDRSSPASGGSRLPEEKVNLGDPGELEEVRLRVKGQSDRIPQNRRLRQDSNRVPFPAEFD